MNGISGFREVRSSTFRSPAYRFLQEQRPQFGTGSLYLSAYGIILPRMKHWGLIDRRFHGRSQTECQRGSSGLFTCKARTVARAVEPAFRKAGHDRRLP